MGIYAEEKEVSPGVKKTFYTVVAEGINRFTGRRIQKKRRGIPSKPKAEMIYKQLWNACREEKPDGVDVSRWGLLRNQYLESQKNSVRSLDNPNGISLHLVGVKTSRLRHTDKWTDMHLELISPKFVTDELDTMERNGMSRSLANQVLKEVKCMFAFAVHLGAIQFNPFQGMKMRRESKKRKEALTHAEVDILLQEAKLRRHKYYYIWLLTVTLGLRRSELDGLKWIDIDFDQRLVYLRRQFIPREGEVDRLKNFQDRTPAIPDYVMPELRKMKLASLSEYVIDVDCHEWDSGAQAKVLRRFCKEIGIKEVTHHQLRATHITLALIDGISLGIVKENVGHAKLSTTDQYFRSAGISMRGQTDGLKIRIPQDDMAEILPLKGSK